MQIRGISAINLVYLIQHALVQEHFVVRIIYHWQVEPEQFDAFQDAWRTATNHIYQNAPGAKGNFMLRKYGSTSEVLTVARWDSLQHWEAFWEGETPSYMQRMHELGDRVSVEIYEEVDNQARV